MLNQLKPISTSQMRGLQTTRPVILAIILLVWIGLPVVAWSPNSLTTQTGDGARSATQNADAELSLEPGKPIERELSGGGSHSYKITMTSGQYLRITVNQQGIDALVALFTPDGKMVGEVDGERATVGAETISAIAEATGAYRVEVRSAEKTARTGRYEVKIEELREAAAEDKYRVAAESLSREAWRLKNGTLEKKRKSIEKYQEALKLFRKVGDRRRETETIKNIGNVYFDFGDIKKALEMFKMALLISQTIGDRNLEADMLGNIGTAYMDLGETQEAKNKYYESLAIFQAMGDRRNTATILVCIGAVHTSLGEMQKALDKCHEALPILREVGDRQGEAHTLSSIGQVYASLGEMRKALDKLNEALLIHRAMGDRMEEARRLSNIGVVYWTLGEMQKALERHTEALPIQRAIDDRNGEAVTLKNIGAVYLSLGELQKAINISYEALPIIREVGDRETESITLSIVASIYLSLGETQKAFEKFNDVLAIARARGDRMLEATTLDNIGAVYLSSGEMREALEKFNEALPIRRSVGDRIGEAVTLDNIGSVYRSSGEMRKAMEMHNEALQIIREVGARSVEAGIISNVGIGYLLSGETQNALEMFNTALTHRRAVGDRYGEADDLLWIARTKKKRGNLTQARQTIEQAIGIVESLRSDIQVQSLRSSYFASRQEYYESYIDILMDQHNQNPAAGFDAAAFEVSERARARSLLELLTESRIDIRQGVDSSLLDRERSLQQRLNAKAAAQVSLLNRKHAPEQADAAAKEIAAITAEYEETQAHIRARSPRYAALTQPQPLGLTEIQQQALDEDTLLIEYALGEKRSYLWLVSHRSIDSYELPPRAEVEAATRRVYELGAARPKRGTPPDPKIIAQARTLSRMLLGPVASRLGGKRLVIVAPGALSYLPFAALPAPEDKKRPTGDYEPLIAKHEVVSIPSASVLAIIRRETAGRRQAAKSIAVLADPVFEVSDPRLESAKGGDYSAEPLAAPAADAEHSELTRAIKTMNFSGARAGFTRLAFSRHEAESIMALTPRGTGLKATDFTASRALALSPQLSQYCILHFATHGLLNSERPELSGLVFSLIDQEGKPQDGFLRLHEIYNLQLNADLVVLSACETGLGKEIKGEGLIGLTRGFMYSGAPRVVASLWNVDDLATAELMKLFYLRMLKDGLPAGAALRAAQLELSGQKRWASPYFWAGFVLHGEWK